MDGGMRNYNLENNYISVEKNETEKTSAGN